MGQDLQQPLISRAWNTFVVPWDFIALNGGPINAGSGPLTIAGPVLPDDWQILGGALLTTKTVILTAAANVIQYSSDGVNWVATAFFTLNTPVTTERQVVITQTPTLPRFYRFSRTDAVGTITQMVLQLTVNGPR